MNKPQDSINRNIYEDPINPMIMYSWRCMFPEYIEIAQEIWHQYWMLSNLIRLDNENLRTEIYIRNRVDENV